MNRNSALHPPGGTPPGRSGPFILGKKIEGKLKESVC